MDHPPITTPSGNGSRDLALRNAAKALEAGFLSEMLKSSGLGKVSEGFGGGTGEEQFASFLINEQAKAMVEKGGIGLAESLYTSLKDRDYDQG